MDGGAGVSVNDAVNVSAGVYVNMGDVDYKLKAVCEMIPTVPRCVLPHFRSRLGELLELKRSLGEATANGRVDTMQALCPT